MNEINYKQLRKASGFTLRKVEELTGISNSYLSQLETGKIKNPSHATVTVLQELYASVDEEMKLSKKKEDQLYNLIHEEIMKARLEIYKMSDQPKLTIQEIDDVLSDLSISAPQKAIDLFKQT